MKMKNKLKTMLNVLYVLLLLSVLTYAGITSSSLSDKTNDYLNKTNTTAEEKLEQVIPAERLAIAKQKISWIASTECTNADDCEALYDWISQYNVKGCSITCK